MGSVAMMKEKRTQGRQRQRQGVWPVMPLRVAGLGAACVSLSASAIHLPVAVEQFFPVARPRNTDAIVVPRDGSEIERGENPLAGVASFAKEEKRAVVG